MEGDSALTLLKSFQKWPSFYVACLSATWQRFLLVCLLGNFWCICVLSVAFQKPTEDVKGTANQFLWCLFLSTMESLPVRLYNRAAVTRTPWNILYWNFLICSEDVVIHWKYAGNSERWAQEWLCAGIGEKGDKCGRSSKKVLSCLSSRMFLRFTFFFSYFYTSLILSWFPVQLLGQSQVKAFFCLANPS